MTFKSGLIEDKSDYTITSDGKIVKVYDRVYNCSSNTLLTLDQVYLNLGILLGSPYPDYAYATCRKASPTRLFHKAPFYDWRVDCQWSTDTTVAAENPTDRPVKRKVQSNETQRYIFRDSDGQIILNAAGDPPDGGIPVNHHMPTVSWQRNEAADTFDIGYFNLLSGKLNSVTFGGWSPETLLLIASAEETWEGKYHFWACNYLMIGNDQGWQPQFLNAGLFQLIGPGSTMAGKLKVRIYESDHTPAEDPRCLYGPGSNIGRQIPLASLPGAGNFIKVKYSGLMDFSSLNLSLT